MRCMGSFLLHQKVRVSLLYVLGEYYSDQMRNVGTNVKLANIYLINALAYANLLYDMDDFRLTRIQETQGKTHLLMGEYGKAERVLREVLVLHEKHCRDNVNVAETVDNLGSALMGLGKYEDARCLYERALAIKEKHLGTDHVEVAATMDNLANVLGDLGDYEGARCLYERALAIREKHYGKDHVEVAATMDNLANVLGDMGD